MTYLDNSDGLEDEVIKVQGKIEDINTALTWVAFTPDNDYTGTQAAITITTNDLGNKGDGGAKSDTDTISITVNSLGDHFDDSPDWKTYPGLLDTSYDLDGRKTFYLGASNTIDHIDQLLELPNGKVLAAGSIDRYVALMRFTSDLQLDPTFGSGGYIKSSTYVHTYIPGISLEIDNQQRLLVSGGGYLSRYLSNGSLDTTFGSQGRANIGAGSSDKGFGTALQPDGRILAATSDGIYRMNPDGSSPSRIIGLSLIHI